MAKPCSSVFDFSSDTGLVQMEQSGLTLRP
jgi:hypothetical protein